ncbi:MAG TPA: hypothetical protein VN253_09045 [Kofleriaceae bacterium]|nr:hypothetical protein [Kofleriaceae bacterium]
MTRLVGPPRLVLPSPPLLLKEREPGKAVDHAPDQDLPLADYLERVAKYVPVEILAAFLAIRGFVVPQGKAGAMPPGLEIALFAALVVLTPLYLIKLGGDVPRKALQVAIATVSFVVWAYAIGGDFFWSAVAKLAGCDRAAIVYEGFAGALVVIWSLAAGLVRLDNGAAPS